jgi:hypothetical protein
MQPNPHGFSKPNSMNNQIISSLAGLRLVETKYAVKFRSDFIMTSDAVVCAWEDFSEAMPLYDEKWRIFNGRILSVSVGNPHGACALPYHFGDLVQVGLADDLRRLWDIPLLTREDAEWCKDRKITRAPEYFAHRYCCEQKVALDNLDRARIPYRKPYHYFDLYEETIADTEAFFLNNLVVLDMPNAGLDTKFGWLLHPDNTFQYRSERFIDLYEHAYGCSLLTKALRAKYPAPTPVPKRRSWVLKLAEYKESADASRLYLVGIRIWKWKKRHGA